MVAMLSAKGRKYHRVSGISYAWSTAFVGLSGFIIAVQTSNQFLIATSVFVTYMMVTAYRSLYLKQLHKVVKAQAIDKLIICISVVAASYLLVLGGYGISKGNYAGTVPLVFGIICARFVAGDIRKFTKGPADKKHWLYNHIAGMVGSYIGGTTAFLAVNAQFFTNDFQVWIWLVPTVVGTPYIIYNIRKYKEGKRTLDRVALTKGNAE